MKKNVSVIFVIVCALLIAGCGEDNETKNTHTDPAFLEGRWVRTATDNLPDFTINSDLSFECEVAMPAPDQGNPHAKVTGNLDHTAEGLGPNDYMIRNMQTVDDADGTYTAGNTILDTQLAGFQNLLATFAPNGGKTEFTFSSGNMAAKLFFGGIYTRQQ